MMENMFERQVEIIKAINSIKVNFGKDSASRKTQEYIQRRLSTLEELWVEFKQNNELLLGSSDKNNPYFTENHFGKMESIYHTLKHTLSTYQPKEDKSSTAPPERIQELLSKQRTNFRALSRLINSINIEEIAEKWEIEEELRNLKSRWNVIDTQHLELDDFLQSSDLEYEEEYSTYEKEYKNIKRTLHRKLSSTAHTQQSTPQLEIPIFTGKYSQWPTFFDLFSEAIHNNSSLTNAQKMQHLKGKLRGEAERLIQHLHISSENYLTAWDILVHRYDNKQLLFTNQIETLINQPSLQKQSAYEIKKLHDTSVECIHAIHNLGVDTNTWDPLLVHLLSKKLDVETLKDYKEARKAPRELPELAEFITFLESKFIALEPIHKKERDVFPPTTSKHVTNPRSSTSSYQPARNFSREKYQGKTYHTRSTKCPLCYFNHDLFKCRRFINMTPALKLQTIAKHQVCRNCLYKHFDNPCISTKRCKECQGDHNSLLHEAFVNTGSSSSKLVRPESSQNDIKHVTKPHNVNFVAGENEEILLTTVLLKVLSADGSLITLRALLDQGSQISLISENAAQMLGLRRHKYHASVSGIGYGSKQSKGLLEIECHSIYDDFGFTTQAMIISRVVNNLPNISFTKKSWSHLQHINLADPDYNISRPIDLLLDASVYSQILMSGLIRGPPQAPIAQQTRLGWILSGNVRTFNCHVIINNVSDLSKYWEMEEISVEQSSSLSAGEEFCEDLYASTTKRLENGMYEVCLPMKPNFEEKLGSSRPKAVAQFYQLERKMAQNQVFSDSYKNFMREYQELGDMVPYTKSGEGPSYYFPHHGVLNLNSTSTKLRVVFNGSSKTSSGLSLNDVMEQGPNLQADLQALIISWRQYRFAMTSDVEKMFRRILVQEAHQNLQSVVWRSSCDAPLQNYSLTTVTYGTKAAPFLAMRTLKQLAMDDAAKYPLGAIALKDRFYMDDYLGGCNDLETAKEVQKQLISILRGAGMNLRKWSSNEPQLLQDLPCDQLNNPYEFRCSESRKTLGLKWNPSSDTFTYDYQFESEPKYHTKRELLSDISKLFDPIGWISPLSIKAKLLFQKAWVTVESWDEKLSSDIIQEWTELRTDFKNIKNIKIPRCIGNLQCTYQIHGFSDASAKAYACTVYCVATNYKGERTSRLITAKTKLAPLSKSLSLPRLELSGALLLSKLIRKVENTLPSTNVKIYAWTDSMIVLGWIHGDQSRWKQFVANRVQQIKEIVPSSNWNYVPSEGNPSDCATRGISVKKLADHRLYWEGPEWLTSFEPDQILRPSYAEPDIEVKKVSYSVNTALHCNKVDFILELLSNHSSITFIAKTVAWVLRFITRSRKPSDTAKTLSLLEMNNAYNIIIKTIQAIDFSEDLSFIKAKGHVHQNSKLSSLNPFIDENGLLRVGGRLKNSHINWTAKHPIILSSHSRFTSLIIDKAHITTLHGGARLTLAYIRNNYWIISGISTVKRELRRCVKCRRFSQYKYQPIMADLPQPRVVPSRPFTHSGIDFTGHVDLKLNKGRGVRTTKGYIAVFICLATKAVHLELVSDLSTPSFLGAFRRFCSRRGVPSHVYSDNGTNFIGANKLLKKEYQEIAATINQEFFDNITEMKVEWHFNAPSHPHAGGLWEAAVKSLKFHIKRVIGEQKLTYEEFTTVLHQIEACLNSRPLCALTENPEDPVLSPGHFLIGGPIITRPQTEPESMCLSKRWQLVQSINKQFWKGWSSDYLQQLQVRSKWKKEGKNIKIDDIVLIKDENLPPGKWAMGRVLELYPGRDGQIRVVSLKTKNNIIKRPVIKLVPLLPGELEDQTPASINHEIPAPESNNTRSRRPRRINFKNFFMTVFMFMSFLLSPSLQQVQKDFMITPVNTNQSIYFDKIADLQHIRDEWTLIIFYNMSTYWQSFETIKKYVEHIKENGSSQDYQSITLQLEHELDEIDHFNQLLKNQLNRRQKRGLINGVGYIANSLFGVLDERFATQYQQDIEHIQQNESHLQTLLHNQTLVIEAEYNIVKRHEDVMQKQFSLIDNHIKDLASEVYQVKQYSSRSTYITFSSLVGHIIISKIRRIQDTLIATLTEINQGHISTNFLSPEQLQNQINIISGRLQRELVLPTDGSNIIQLYKLLRVAARVTDKYLIAEVKIPILNNEIFELDKIISLPKKKDKKYYQLTTKFPYIGFNINKDSLILLSESDLQSCRHLSNEKVLCFLNSPVYTTKIKQSICDVNIVDGDTDLPLCKSELSRCKERWIKLHADNEWLYICCEQCSVRLICPAGITSQVLIGNGVIRLGPMCILKGDDFTIYSHNYFSNRLDINQKLEIPQSSVLNNIINTSSIDIPKLENHEGELEVLKTQISEIKEQSANSMDFSVHDVHHYALGYIMVSLFIIIGGVLVFRRLRRRRQLAGGEASRGTRDTDAAPAAAPAPAAGAGVQRSISVSDVNVLNKKAISEVFSSVPNVRNVSGEIRQSVLSLDKSTSPTRMFSHSVRLSELKD